MKLKKKIKWCCAWKSIFFKLLDDRPPVDKPAHVQVCSDDKTAADTVIKIINTLKGFQGLYSGELKHTKIVELFGPTYATDMNAWNAGKNWKSYWRFESNSTK